MCPVLVVHFLDAGLIYNQFFKLEYSASVLDHLDLNLCFNCLLTHQRKTTYDTFCSLIVDNTQHHAIVQSRKKKITWRFGVFDIVHIIVKSRHQHSNNNFLYNREIYSAYTYFYNVPIPNLLRIICALLPKRRNQRPFVVHWLKQAFNNHTSSSLVTFCAILLHIYHCLHYQLKQVDIESNESGEG